MPSSSKQPRRTLNPSPTLSSLVSGFVSLGPRVLTQSSLIGTYEPLQPPSSSINIFTFAPALWDEESSKAWITAEDAEHMQVTWGIHARDATGFASFSLASSLWDQSQDTLEKYSDVLARFARRRGSLDTALDIRRRTESVMNSQGLFRTLVAGNEQKHHHENSLPSLEEELFEDAVEIRRELQAELPEDFVFAGDVHLDFEPELSLAGLPSSQVDFELSSEALTNACRNCVTRKIDCVRPTEGGITCLQCRKAKISCQYEEEYSTKRRTMLEAAIRDLDQMIRLREARFDKRDLTGRRVLRDLIGVAQINRISVTKSENAKTGLGIGDEALAKSALSHLLEICQDVDYQLCK